MDIVDAGGHHPNPPPAVDPPATECFPPSESLQSCEDDLRAAVEPVARSRQIMANLNSPCLPKSESTATSSPACEVKEIQAFALATR